MLNSILPNFIVPLGLFFSGLRLIDSNLRQVAGRRLRTIIGRLTQQTWVASLVGLLAGAFIQSSSGIVFILVSLVSSGLTTVRRALPIVTWANVGCSALVVAAVLDLRIGILYVIGVAGAVFAFDRSRKFGAFGAVFGVGMLFYGIELMKIGAEPLQHISGFSSLVDDSRHQSTVFAFLSAMGFSFVTQSSAAVSILTIGLPQTGLIGVYPTMMAIYGANVGSTFSRMLLSSTLRGSTRQLTVYQDLFKITGAVIFVSLLYIEAFGGVPLVRAFVEVLSSRIEHQMALVFLLFNLVTALLFPTFQSTILETIHKWLPADPLEDHARPLYLYDEALSEPATALDLLEKEQLRLAKRLLAYPAAMRTPSGSRERQQVQLARAAFSAVVGCIEQFQHELVHQQIGSVETERATRLQSRLTLLVYLEDSMTMLITTTDALPGEGRLRRQVSTFIEALDYIMVMTVDAIEST